MTTLRGLFLIERQGITVEVVKIKMQKDTFFMNKQSK